jgi:hypothetical protein
MTCSIITYIKRVSDATSDCHHAKDDILPKLKTENLILKVQETPSPKIIEIDMMTDGRIGATEVTKDSRRERRSKTNAVSLLRI